MSQLQEMRSGNLSIIKGGEARPWIAEEAHPSQSYVSGGRITFQDIPLTRAAGTKIRVPSDDARNQSIIVDEIIGEIEDGSTQITQMADRYLNEAWWDWVESGKVNGAIQLVIADVANPLNFAQWSVKLAMINASCASVTLGGEKNPQSMENNEATPITADLSWWYLKVIRRLTGAAVGGAAIARECLDVAHRKYEKGGYVFYILLTNVVATTPSQVVVYNSYKKTTATVSITALATAGLANSIYVIGDNIFVMDKTQEQHYYQSIADTEAALDNWATVDGYTTATLPNALFAISSSEIIAVGDGGYIYRLDGVDRTPVIVDAGDATAQNLNAVHGKGSQIVGVGASNSVVYSSDGGQNFSAQTGPSVGNALTAVYVHSEDTWFIGTGNGELWYTDDAGSTYNALKLSPVPTAIREIAFAKDDPINGFIVGENATKAYIYRTTDSGYTWRSQVPDIKDVPDGDKLNALAVGDHNNLMAVGQNSGGTSGQAVLVKPLT